MYRPHYLYAAVFIGTAGARQGPDDGARRLGRSHHVARHAAVGGIPEPRRYIVMAYVVIACIVMACIVMACIAMAYIVMACIVMTLYSYGPYAIADGSTSEIADGSISTTPPMALYNYWPIQLWPM